MPFDFRPLDIPDVVMVHPRVFQDPRGRFMETYRRTDFERAGVRATFVQDNLARSTARGVLRGLHFQRAPHAQAKLVCCTRGRVFDVAVDIRRGSPTFGRFVAAELSEDPPSMLYVPRGFAHGYITLTDVADVAYKVDAEYAPHAEAGLRWDDPTLKIPWPIAEPILTERDRGWPTLLELSP
ncbi:MAG: dTDP-4-dehydrorhamnose 3,5-epimerase [Planctomycetes bacterium]|nr:dTDP-4-dehydrorhamnose 3,5-epimerase [Planctomycetota bacterium]